MEKVFFSLALIFQFGVLRAQGDLPVAHSEDPPPSHAQWDALLKAHVSESGAVDYRGFLNDRESLGSYLQLLGSSIPGQNWGREAQLAYFINLYNAATVQLILEHYPVNSIRKIPRPWGRKWIRIGDGAYSLDHIEHQILRPMGEPRIHFAINCASRSCPKLLQEAFTGERLELQLEEATRGFINDPSRNRISPRKAELSKIFKWFRQDFEAGGRTLTGFLNPRLPDPLEVDVPIEFLPYDWSLNSQLP